MHLIKPEEIQAIHFLLRRVKHQYAGPIAKILEGLPSITKQIEEAKARVEAKLPVPAAPHRVQPLPSVPPSKLDGADTEC